jgi:acetylornithine aminotransferase
VAAACFEKRFIINAIQDKVLRFAPPLIVETSDIDRLISVLDSLL